VSRALAGLRVVDLTTELWAALAAAMLGDFGAEVIRLDAPGWRGWPRAGDDAPAPWNWRDELAHRNKTSLAVDLERERGRAIAHALVARSDVVLTDWPLAVLTRRGLEYESATRLKPDLIYARGSGFGPKGPDRDLPALDELAAARTGMMPILPQPGRPPVYPGHGQMYTTVMLAFGVVAALRHRQRTGEGQRVDASLLGGNMYGASLDLQAFLAIGGERFLRPISRLDAGNPMSGTMYRSQDGPWVTLTMPDTDRWWPAFAPLVGLDPADPRFDSHEKRCGEHRHALMQALEAAFRRAPAAHWRRAFLERQLSADVIEDYAFPAADPQVYRNRYILALEHPSLGPIRTLGFPIFMSETPARLRRTAPCRGQHSAEILREVLGYSEDEIVALRDERVVA
jgi:crotonobetainyl-CoA:carnitine CoA-transferase CaiB-like acyl-CoA transferase